MLLIESMSAWREKGDDRLEFCVVLDFTVGAEVHNRVFEAGPADGAIGAAERAAIMAALIERAFVTDVRAVVYCRDGSAYGPFRVDVALRAEAVGIYGH